jgi:hypothetical protein
MKVPLRFRKLFVGFFVLCVSLVIGIEPASGKSTKLITSWKNHTFSGAPFRKVLVVGMSANPGRRADFEDDLSESLSRSGIEVIPGNTILLRPDASPMNLDYVRMQIREHKIDAVVLSRLVSVKESVTYIPPAVAAPYPYYGSFYRYYGAVSPVVYSPGYLMHDKTVRIQTNVYATTEPDAQLVWTGTSDSFNPKDAHKVIKDVVKLITAELTKDKVI